MPTLNLLCLEAVLIRPYNRFATLVSANQPPRLHMRILYYEQLLCLCLNSSIIIAGDLNSKHIDWGYRVINPSSRKLHSFTANTPYTVSVLSEPAYFPSNVNRLSDIIRHSNTQISPIHLCT